MQIFTTEKGAVKAISDTMTLDDSLAAPGRFSMSAGDPNHLCFYPLIFNGENIFGMLYFISMMAVLVVVSIDYTMHECSNGIRSCRADPVIRRINRCGSQAHHILHGIISKVRPLDRKRQRPIKPRFEL